MRSIFDFPESGMELAADQSFAFGDVVIKITELDKRNKKLVYAIVENHNETEVVIPYGEVGSIKHNGKILFSLRENSETGAVIIKPNSKGIKFARDLDSVSMRAAIAQNLDLHKKTLIDISNLEQDENVVNSSQMSGYQSSIALKGYAVLCELYLFAKFDGLKNEEKKALNNVINDLLVLAAKMEEIEKFRDVLYEKYKTSNTNYTLAGVHKETKDKIKKISEKDAKTLIRTGRLPIPFGFTSSIFIDGKGGVKYESGHHELAEITFIGDKNGVGKYELTIYNAGYDSNWTGAGDKVEAKVTYELNINSIAAAQEFIELINVRQVIGNKGLSSKLYAETMDKIKATWGRKVRANSATPQTRGNCTTRSTREFVEDKVPGGLFSNIYRFLSNPQQLQVMLDSMSKGLSLERRTASNVVKFTGTPDPIIQGKIFTNSFQDVTALLDARKVKAFYKTSPSGPLTTLGHIAVAKGNEALLRKCLAMGMLGNEVDGKGETLLVFANKSGKQNMVDIIVDNLGKNKRSDILSVSNVDGLSPLVSALENDRLDAFEKLIEEGASIDPAKNGGYLVLNALVNKMLGSDRSSGSLDIISRYSGIMVKVLERNPNFDIHLKDGMGKSFAHAAIAILQNAGDEDDKNLGRLGSTLARGLVANFQDNADARDLVEAILVKTSKFSSQESRELALFYLQNSQKWNDDRLFAHVFANYLFAALKEKDPKMLDVFIALPQTQSYLTTILDIMIFHNKELKDAKPENLIKLLKKYELPGGDTSKELKELIEKNFSEVDAKEILSHAKFAKTSVPAKSIEKEVKVLEKKLDEVEVKVNYNISQRKEEVKAAYQFGDFTRSFLSLITGIDMTRGEEGYQFGDATRGVLAWVTGDSTWQRRVEGASEQNQGNPKGRGQSSSSFWDIFGGNG